MRPNLLATIAVLALAGAAAALAACSGGGGAAPTAVPTATATQHPATPDPFVLRGQRLTFDGRLYEQQNTTAWNDPGNLEQIGALEVGGAPVEVYRISGGPPGYLLTRQQTTAGDVWLEWLDAGESAPPGAVPGQPPGIPGEPLPVTPILPDNPAPDPGGVISVTAVPPVGTAIAEPGEPVDPALRPTPDPAAPVATARADLAARLGIAADEITVVSVQAEEWPDGCLGLGGPQEACIAMMIPGFRVTLEAGGGVYVYRTGLGQARLEQP